LRTLRIIILSEVTKKMLAGTVLVQGLLLANLLLANIVFANEEKFQKCCGEEKLYSPKDRSCHTPTSQGPCKSGEWFVMARDSSGMGVCQKAPCKNNQMILVEGRGCTSKYDTSQCSKGTRPWFSVYGDWECKRHRVFLPFGQQKEPYDKVWDRCNVKLGGSGVIVA